VSDERAAGEVGLPPEGSAAEAIVSQAGLSLAEARKTHSDPRTAVGHYLDAADSAVRSVGLSSGNQVTEEARSIYNAASQEVAVLLRSSAELWNRTETIPSADGIYRPAAPGSKRQDRSPSGDQSLTVGGLSAPSPAGKTPHHLEL
jgi:hypothetical protein